MTLLAGRQMDDRSAEFWKVLSILVTLICVLQLSRLIHKL